MLSTGNKFYYIKHAFKYYLLIYVHSSACLNSIYGSFNLGSSLTVSINYVITKLSTDNEGFKQHMFDRMIKVKTLCKIL